MIHHELASEGFCVCDSSRGTTLSKDRTFASRTTSTQHGSWTVFGLEGASKNGRSTRCLECQILPAVVMEQPECISRSRYRQVLDNHRQTYG